MTSMRSIPFSLLCALLAALLSGMTPRSARAAHDPARTATIYVHGFDLSGADRSGTYGDTYHEAVADSIASLAGLPVAGTGEGPLPPNVVIGVGYYGDTLPAWYTTADRAAVDSATALWGGGVPRYAAIVANFARHVLARSGARQVNFVSASFGSLVVRWLIENDVAGLADDGRIARWLSVEGLVGGNWAASHGANLLDGLSLQQIDLEHMTHDWIDAHLHLPHTEADNARYAGILIGEVASTDDGYNDAALSALMLANRTWQPNDGVQALPDAVFGTVTARSRLQGLPPTTALFHATHFGLEQVRGAWAEAATFLTQRRRVTVTMTSATVTNLHEPELPYWDWRPGEIVFDSRVFSPAVAKRWGITDPVTAHRVAGGAAPLRRFSRDGDTQTFEQVVFDDFVLPEETSLTLDLGAYDVDNDPHYGVFETTSTPSYDDLGHGTLSISTTTPGSYTFNARDWSCRLTVTVSEYPFDAALAVPPASPSAPLALSPNPSRGLQAIRIPDGARGTVALDVLDVRGRRLRHVAEVTERTYRWDGRDDRGRAVPAGVYLVRVTSAAGTWRARSLVIR